MDQEKSHTICLYTVTFFSLVIEGQDRIKCRTGWNTNPQIREKRERSVLLPTQMGKGALKGRLIFIPLYILEGKPVCYKETKGARREERWPNEDEAHHSLPHSQVTQEAMDTAGLNGPKGKVTVKKCSKDLKVLKL